MEKRRYALLAFGCQMNLHDAERISGVLQEAGWRESDVEEADAVILLTCCVRESAERRLYGRLSSLKTMKESRPLTIAVGGCLAQKEGVGLLRRAPYVDVVFGTHQYTEIDVLLAAGAGSGVCAVAMDGVRFSGVPSRRRENFRAWVTISNGCDNHCAYCIVPFVRGRESSREMEEVAREVGALAGNGVKEINLLGQNVNSYRRREEGRSRFADLLRLLGQRFPEPWIRFTTSHPRDFDCAVISAIADTDNVCEHVHLPMQAGSDRVLRAMNRGYSREEYLEKARQLRRAVPDVSLTTDLIVGFPGETEKDFRDTLEMVELCGFDAAFTFVYNPREGTAAARLPDDVTGIEKRERLECVAGLTRRLTARSLEREVGKERFVLISGPSRKDPGRWAARTRQNKLVHFVRGGADLTGRLALVRITSAGSWSLQARLLEVM